jgi:hypothetical protein
MTVSNESWSFVLDGLSETESKWYYCGDYYKINTPEGVMSAYPYGPMSWGTFSGSGWTSLADPGGLAEPVTSSNSDRRYGAIQITYTNTFTTRSWNKIRFDCTGRYPGYEANGITVRSPTAITATTATISATVALINPNRIGNDSRWHVEYGTAPGDYSQQTASVGVPHPLKWDHDLPPITLTGLTPGTTHNYRVVFEENNNWLGNKWLTNYSGTGNTFTTAVSPQTGQTYGIASFADGRAFIDLPDRKPDVGLKLQLWEGNGTPAQQWSLVDSGARDGYFKIVSAVEMPGLCLEIFGGPNADAPIDQYTCDPNQRMGTV